MTWAAILLLSIVLLALAARWFVNANPASLVRGIRLGAIWLAVIVVLVLVATGRLPWLTGVIAPLIPMFLAVLARARQRHRPASSWGGGQQSSVTTDFLDMTFDHDSGELDGRVTAGAFEGRTLSSMSLNELKELLREVKAAQDTNSLNVLASFLDRTYGDGWRDGQDSAAGEEDVRASASSAMTRDEAWRVLGLEPGASEDEIRKAHRNLMKQLHPDHGGSDYLAAKVNEAKDLLLGR